MRIEYNTNSGREFSPHERKAAVTQPCSSPSFLFWRRGQGQISVSILVVGVFLKTNPTRCGLAPLSYGLTLKKNVCT